MIPNFELFNPKGVIAEQQADLITTVLSLMLVAVIPFLIMAFFFAWKYRAKNNAKYTPNVENNSQLQWSWITLLVILIIFIANLAWKNSHALDPRKPIVSAKASVTVQVVALEWKWLFIYPEQKIASVNFMPIPVNTPINLEITADAPMNSFLIPQLGGQMYAMNGMKTTLHLMANEIGDYRGFSSNISGEGFSGMHFIARASSDRDFNAWVEASRINSSALNYEELSQPSKNNPPITYVLSEANLFDSIVTKFMTHEEHHHVW